MRISRLPLLAGALCAASALVLSGCASPTQKPPAATTAAAPAGLNAAAAPQNCADGVPPNASIDPGGIATDPGKFPPGSTMAKIHDRGYLRLATNGDVLNWGATNTKTGDPEGYDVDLAAAVARALDVDLRRTQYVVIPYSERQSVLAENRADLVAQQMTITCDRWSGTTPTAPAINFSTAYYTAGAKVLVRKGTQVKEGEPVCGTTASTSLEAIVEQGVQQGDQKPVKVKKVEAPSAGQCLVKFEEGEVAAVVGDETTLAGFTKQDPSSTIVLMNPINARQYGLGTQAKQPDFTRFVNAVLQKLRADGTLTTLYDKWMKPLATPGSGVSDKPPVVPAPVYGRKIDALERKS
jgi:polar amino acid transport system substrate-binding protein